MALPFHLVFLLCLTGGLLISGTWSASIEPRARGCTSGWTALGNRCFKAHTNEKTMADADNDCINQGGNLASIHSTAENYLVRKLIRRKVGRNVEAWIGLSDARQEGRWFWTDGSNLDFRDWGHKEPNNAGGDEDCVATMDFGAHDWNDVPCDRRFPYVCARDK